MFKSTALIAGLLFAGAVADEGLPYVNAAAFKCLALNLYHEARGEGIEGMRAVASVVLTRASKQDKPVCDVVYKRKQFSWANTKQGRAKPLGNDNIDNVLTVAYQALAGNVVDVTGGADHYHTCAVAPKWTKHMTHTYTVGNHRFYKQL
jgi:spore germination cell wall hydrolase CwlJ-like protein